ncbi:MAG: UPF0175 family protein [Bacteroidota bacterium]
MPEIPVSFPSMLAEAITSEGNAFAEEMRMLSVVKLYELGRISSGIAAQSLGLSKLDFLDRLAQFQVSYLSDEGSDSLASDFQNA